MKTSSSSLVIGQLSLVRGLGSRIRCTMSAKNRKAHIWLIWALNGFRRVLSAEVLATPRCKAVQSVYDNLATLIIKRFSITSQIIIKS